MYTTNLLAQNILNTVRNPVLGRYLDYSTNFPVPFKPKGIDIEGRTEPVTNISEIAPTRSTQNVLAEGIANAALRNKFDFTQPFSTVVKGSGEPYIRDPSQTYDYSGYKLGNPEEGFMGTGREVWETLKTVYGGDAPNIVANTLGDYTVRYTPKLDPNHPEVMNIYDRYDFKGKGGEGHGSPYDINVNLPSDLLAQIKNYYQDEDEKGLIAFDPNNPQVNLAGMMRRKKMMKDQRATEQGIAQVAMEKRIQEAEKKRIEQEKIKTAQDNWKPTYNPASSHAEAQATGGDYHSGHQSTVGGQTTDWGSESAMIARGGLAQHAPRYANGGLIDFYRYGGFI